MNNSTFIYLGIVIILFLIVYFFRIKNKDGSEDLYLNNYYKRRFFFTPSENNFYKQLYKTFNIIGENRFVIFSKVRVSDIIGTDKKYLNAWKKINPRHFDFIVCDINKDFEPILILEFDGYTHQNDSSVKLRDNIKDKICEHIQLPLLRITKDHTDDELKELLNKYL